MQINMRIQIIVGIWVLVSMMDFMPCKGEHETGIFCHFYGKSGATFEVHRTIQSAKRKTRTQIGTLKYANRPVSLLFGHI